MSDFDNTPITPSSSGTPGPVGWVQTWIKAVSQPKEQTFIDISESPEAQPRTAYIWIFVIGTLSTIVSGIVQMVIMAMSQGDARSAGSVVGSALVGVVCGSPIVGGISVLFFALWTAIVQWIAKLFGGTGTYDKLVYAVASFSVPISLITMLLVPFNAIPILGICTGLVSALIGFYSLFLQITAVKAINRFGWGQAAGSVLLPSIVIIVFCGCIVGIGLAIMGPMIGDIFNQINQGMQ
jgi:hypothetical protein